MGQVSWRADADLIVRVKRAAAEHGKSMNEFITWVVETAVDPEHASSESERLRERLKAAGILAEVTPVGRPRRSEEERADTRRAASVGRSLVDHVLDGRGE